MKTPWIESALIMGAKLTIEAEGKLCRPRMDWPSGVTVYGHAREMIIDAIDDLEDLLCREDREAVEDAPDEITDEEMEEVDA